jgi:hypothetical protein
LFLKIAAIRALVVTIGDVNIRFDRSFQYFTEYLRTEGLVELMELVRG